MSDEFIITPEYVVKSFAMAFAVLVRLPNSHLTPVLSQMRQEIVSDKMDWPDEKTRVRSATPAAAHITAMDEIFLWLGFVPNRVERRIILKRSVTKGTGQPARTWRSIGREMHVEHKTVKAWHNRGIDRIVIALNQGRGNFLPDPKFPRAYDITVLDAAEVAEDSGRRGF